MEKKETTLSDFLQEEEENVSKKDETMNENTSEDNISVANEDVKQDKDENSTEEPKEKKLNVRELDDDTEIGDLGLTKKELREDMTTPAQNMSNLKKFSDKMELEEAIVKEQYHRAKEEHENREEINEILNSEKTEFDDEVIDDEKSDLDNSEKAEENQINPPEKTLATENVAVKEEPRKIVLEQVKIRKIKDDKKKNQLFNELLMGKRKRQRTTRVPLINSGYIADMSPMSSPEIRDLSNTLRSKDAFGYWEYLYKILHEKIASTSIGSIDFETFLKCTSLGELEVLLYGLFCSTYPDKNSFPTQCQSPKCNLKFNFEYSNQDYMTFDDTDENGNSKTKDLMRKLVSSQAGDPKEFFRTSIVNSLYRVPLSDSGYIVELRHPTLFNQLYDVIKQMVDEQLENASETTLNRMPYIEKVLVPYDADDLSQGYVEYEELTQKITLLTGLSEDDDLDLEEAISENILSTSHFVFKMHDVTCPICKFKQTDENVDFRQLLFMIHRIRSVKKK